MKKPTHRGLYRPSFEHDSCGFGLTVQMDGQYSHDLVKTANSALDRLTHRGAIGGDGKTGDGCGLLLKVSPRFWRAIAEEHGWELPQQFAVGMVFLSTDAALAQKGRKAIEDCIASRHLDLVGWRKVPTNDSVLGSIAKEGLPTIEQVFIGGDGDMDEAGFARALFMVRRLAEKAMRDDADFYIPSMSAKVISYKGLMLPKYMPEFYVDLVDERMEASLAVFHQRFSTNTLPSWKLAQPFRFLAHNGEINTIQGNRNWSCARTAKLESPLLPELKDIEPLVGQDGSDSSSLDNMLEILLAGGVDLFRAMAMLIPPAWQNVEDMDPDLRAFHRYNSMHMEPWDGPAGIVLTDGRYAVCQMDRNGLRPARYAITKNRVITLASEAGVMDAEAADVISRGRVKPGQSIAIDTKNGTLLMPDDINNRLKAGQPYKRWLKRHEQHLVSQLDYQLPDPIAYSPAYLKILQKAYQLTYEEVEVIIKTLANNGAEAVGSMGDDAPFAVLSKLVRSPYDYFRQQFAQVTNPPIDPLREQMVMSLEVCLGREQNVFIETPEHAARLVIDSPVVSSTKFRQLRRLEDPRFVAHEISLFVGDGENLHQAIERICLEAENAVLEGATLIVLSDLELVKDKIPVHALLATGAVHHHLIRKGLRCDANLLVETATARDSHQIATLIGYGATAVIPWLAYETVRQMVRDGSLKSKETQALRAYRKGLNKGLFKIMSKMGISTIASYRGAQLFESIGLADEVVNTCFVGTVNRIGGSNFADLEADQRKLIERAWDSKAEIAHPGLLKYVHEGEYHAYNPEVIGAIHEAVETGDYDEYKKFRDLVNDRPPTVLRDLLQLKKPAKSIDIGEVEPLEDIMLRFDSAGMSLGALSPEAHEALAMAMNSIGGRSNSGEGGEDPRRYGTNKMSKIKQIASGRFGVTPHYLVNAEVLQIKVAQGAKPGEGGQLPGDKVNPMIARLRYSMPGVALISPPPHHDIYSIEDLAQLIFDLKQINPQALVSVKLVSEAGVGTIAAGVVKASADLITISGYDGGTGASPLTSVKYAGGPWELGLVETQQVLRANQLRDKVRLQADGGLKTGLDVVKAAILGAESFGFGTMPMVALGCKYLRICHLNNCATGVATQHATLRKRHFKGSPERVVNYFKFVAQETREIMAQLGVKTLDELIGRVDFLEVLPGETERQTRLELSPILSNGGVADEVARSCQVERNEPWDNAALGKQMVADMKSVIEAKSAGAFEYEIRNTDRSIGTRVSGEIARLHGNQGMSDAPINVRLRGTAGQSFGAFNAGGLNLKLVGEANDYVGKGMAGGSLIVRPSEESRLRTNETPIVGNTCLYGATGGHFFAAGTAGERFAVRNSGAIAVVEGIGDHGCEYMTGGAVVVLGQVGQNFGAGMTGGMAFVLDEDRRFVDLYNHELIDITRLTQESMEMHLAFMERLLDQHIEATESAWAMKIRDEMMDYVGKFWLVTPKAADLGQLLGTLLAAA